MPTITIEIDEPKASILREKAKKFGLLPDQFVTASIDDLISRPDAEFESVLNKILSKNKELYKRLS